MLRAHTPQAQHVSGLAHPATLCPPLRTGLFQRLPGNQAARPRPPARAPIPALSLQIQQQLMPALPAFAVPVSQPHRLCPCRNPSASLLLFQTRLMHITVTRSSQRLHSPCSCVGTCFKWLIVLEGRPPRGPTSAEWNWMRSPSPSGSRSRALGTRSDTRPLLRSYQRPQELTQL